MSRLAVPLFALVSLGWLGLSFLLYFGWALGDCRGDDAACWAAKHWSPTVIFWRWLAVQLVGWIAFRRLRRGGVS